MAILNIRTVYLGNPGTDGYWYWRNSNIKPFLGASSSCRYIDDNTMPTNNQIVTLGEREHPVQWQWNGSFFLCIDFQYASGIIQLCNQYGEAAHTVGGKDRPPSPEQENYLNSYYGATSASGDWTDLRGQTLCVQKGPNPRYPNDNAYVGYSCFQQCTFKIVTVTAPTIIQGSEITKANMDELKTYIAYRKSYKGISTGVNTVSQGSLITVADGQTYSWADIESGRLLTAADYNNCINWTILD